MPRVRFGYQDFTPEAFEAAVSAMETDALFVMTATLRSMVAIAMLELEARLEDIFEDEPLD